MSQKNQMSLTKRQIHITFHLGNSVHEKEFTEEEED